jgi:hypothetical protein
MHLIDLSPSSPLHHVYCFPCTTLNTLVPALSKETHASGQNARAQYLATACQTRGERAQTASWTRQSAMRPVALVLPCTS